ncbi:hypothetical protein F8M41_005629 [Gigaspora margarita]|uniref:Uncharacterized protein n=1 Tax=Gigaspora margarita TaxID=4874 RepID=A0A8H4A6Q3_GIGMA|nr:hypothetical protein F8M41_005629 [Gigaspora margarita]
MEAERKEISGLKEAEKINDDDEMIVNEEDGKKEKDVTKPTKKKDLDNACELWIKKVEKLRRKNNFKKTKGPTEKEYAKIEETPYKIGVEKNKDKGAIKIGKREASTIFLVQFRIQKGPYNKNKKSERLSQKQN